MVAGGEYKITGGLSSDMWLLLHSNGGSQINLFDTGNGITFTYPDDGESYNLTIAIRENTVLSDPVTFSPKIYALDYKINNPTQFPSKPLIRVTFEDVAELIELPYYYNLPYNLAGVTFSDGGDGYIEINGTTTTGFSFLCKYRMPAPPEGTYHLSGCPEGGSSSGYSQYVVLLNNNTSIKFAYDYGDGADLEISSVQTGSSYTLSVYIRAASAGMTFEHFRIKPSLVPVTAANCRVHVGENLITLKNDYPYIDVDSEIQDCYYGNVNANSNVILQNNDFPTIEPGVNGIELGAGVSKVELIPRWFRL